MTHPDQIAFYQSGEIIYTVVDFSNELHRILVEELIKSIEEPRQSAAYLTKIMKKAGFQPSSNLYGGVAWSSDLFLFSPKHLHNTFNNEDFKNEVRVILDSYK